mgnify:CR=1 FL=1
MANEKELRALITLAGKIDPSLQTAILKASGETMKLSNNLENAGRKMNEVGTIAKGAFLGGVASNAITEISSRLWEFGKKSLMLSSDLKEVQNVVDTTFGKSSGQINNWSKNALEAYGLSELQAKQYTGTLGAMLKSSGLAGDSIIKMSENMTALSGDFASFYNLDQEAAFEKIQSGISGETEPLKALGINMSVANLEAFALSEGIKTSYSKMDQASQTLLRYNYLMSVSGDAQGDFAKTSDQAANQMRLFETNIDQMGSTLAVKVLPAVTEFLKYGNDILMGNKELSPVIYGVGAALTSLLVISTITKLYDAWKLSTFAMTLAQWGLNTALLANPIGLIIVGIGLLVAAGVLLYRNWDTIKAAAIDLWDKISNTFKNGVNTAIDYVNKLIDGMNLIPGIDIDHISKLSVAYNPQSVGNYKQLERYAEGGFADKPSLFAEDGLEVAIPIEKTPRSLGLLNQTAQILGASDSKPVQINYAPVIQGGNAAEVKQELSLAFEQFKNWVEQYLDAEARVSFG